MKCSISRERLNWNRESSKVQPRRKTEMHFCSSQFGCKFLPLPLSRFNDVMLIYSGVLLHFASEERFAAERDGISNKAAVDKAETIDDCKKEEK